MAAPLPPGVNNVAPPARKGILLTPLSIVPILLMAIGLLVVGFFLSEMWRSPLPIVTAQTPPLPSPVPPTLTELERDLKPSPIALPS